MAKKTAPPQPKLNIKTATNIAEIEDIDDIVDGLLQETWKEKFVIKVQKYMSLGDSNKYLWANQTTTNSDELESMSLRQLLIDKYKPGVFKLMFVTPDGQVIKEADKVYKVTVGDITKPINIRTIATGPQTTASNPPQHDPVNSNTDLIRKKAELEMKKISVEDLKIDQQIKALSGPTDNKNDKVMELQLQIMTTNFQNAIKELASSLKPNASGNGELVELKALITTQNAKIEAMGKEKEQHGWMDMFIKMMQENTARADAQMKAQTDLIKQTLDKQGDKSGLLESLRTLKELKKLSEDDSPREEELIEPRPTTSFWDKIGEGVVRVWDRLEASGKFGPVSKNQDEIVLTPEQKEKIVAEMEPEITAIVEARVKAQLAELQPAENKNTETEHTKINETFKMILSEIDTRPVPRKWVEYARNNLPKSMLDEIRDANEPSMIIKVIEKYSAQYVDKEVISNLQVKLNETANQEWFFVGINELKVSL